MTSYRSKASQKQERDIAAALGGRVTPASGAFWHRKGDVATTEFVIEAKQTEGSSAIVSLHIWEKIRREALLVGKVPILMLRIQKRDLVVLDLEDFLALTFSETDMGAGELP